LGVGVVAVVSGLVRVVGWLVGRVVGWGCRGLGLLCEVGWLGLSGGWFCRVRLRSWIVGVIGGWLAMVLRNLR